MAQPTLFILAAGMGSRFGGLKQMEPFGPSGETILDYSVYDALRAGFGKIVFVIRKEMEKPFAEIVERFQSHIAIGLVFQELETLPEGFSVPDGRTKPWGTTHAVLMAAEAIHEPFAVINADDFYGAESFRVIAEHLQSGTEDYAMAGFRLRNTLSDFGSVARGVCQVSSDGYLQSVVENMGIERDGTGAKNTDAAGNISRFTGDEPVSMNFWGFTPGVFPLLRQEFLTFLKSHGTELKSECYLPTVVDRLIAAGQARVRVLTTGSAWFGVTYREDRAHVVEQIRLLAESGAYPKQLWP